ncbi:hypothetical protein [Altericista sp. CCNU0014]|uniref:hypothetical protein n=1 Tax=Altericista sp. CCNU0014 TaxID=3082949 RepID=UPI00384E8DE5
MLEITPSFDLAQLPLILAGPILRRVEPEAVTVWLALQSPCQVRLQVIPADPIDPARSQPLLTGTAKTVALGKGLHVVAITARVDRGETLGPGVLYAYDLSFTRSANDGSDPVLSLQQALRSPELASVSVSYFSHGLPTFSLPPSDLNRLRIFHGSCRKVYDKGIDALPIIDQIIAETASHPLDRPHHLFFTGDQIYGDEVADPLLWGIQQWVPALFGRSEPLAVDVEALQDQLKPGNRQSLVERYAGLTASQQGDEQKTNSHLIAFSEYCTSYLFSWSECLWQLKFPLAEQIGIAGKSARIWNEAVRHLAATAQSQAAVRRALANVPTYTIFDDHDVSDDWNLNRAWCLRVLGKPLGRQVVRNALLAYAIFQAWGNTPEQFDPNTPGAQLLAATEAWCEMGAERAAAPLQIDRALGLPQIDPLTDLPQFRQEKDCCVLDRPQNCLKWHYRICGASHEVIVLDTRTQRGYPLGDEPDAPPQLLSPSAYEQQLQPMLEAARQENRDRPIPLTLVVAPTNVFTLELLDRLHALGDRLNKSFHLDIGDSWNLEGSSRSQLLRVLFRERQQVVLLSGDIHYGAALRVDYWEDLTGRIGTFPRFRQQPNACLVQLTASAICNSEPITELLQTKIKSLFPERRRYWMASPPDYTEIEVTPSPWQSLHWRIWNRFARRDGLKDRKSLQFSYPQASWGYRSQWLRRQPVARAIWRRSPDWLARVIRVRVSYRGFWQGLWLSIWQRRWLQEGKEVVGLNNIGLVQFDWPGGPEFPPTVIYDLYWYTPWKSQQIAYSRYKTQLKPQR